MLGRLFKALDALVAGPNRATEKQCNFIVSLYSEISDLCEQIGLSGSQLEVQIPYELNGSLTVEQASQTIDVMLAKKRVLEYWIDDIDAGIKDSHNERMLARFKSAGWSQ